ncbi:MAG: hypothetical protein ABI415_03350 [Flavitalea sp.]
MPVTLSRYKNLRIAQWQYESDGWKRALEFIQFENIYSKNNLAELIKNRNGQIDQLVAVESHLEWFVQQEILITILRSDIKDFKWLLEKELLKNGSPEKNATSDYKRIYKEIEKIKEAHRGQKSRFDKFLIEIF